MKRLNSVIVLISLISFFPSTGRAVSIEEEDTTDAFDSLISIVISAEQPQPTLEEIPDVLVEVVNNYYAEEVVPESVATGVLSYVENVYKDFGYYEKCSDPMPDFRLPVVGRITSGYGYRPRFGRIHKGVDISLNIGDTVRCALPGKVVKTGYEPGGYGRFVIVRHPGGLETVYAHLSAGIVLPGQKLQSGTPLGIGGNSGNSTGPHLHFETRYFGVAVDPVSWFNLFPKDGS